MSHSRLQPRGSYYVKPCKRRLVKKGDTLCALKGQEEENIIAYKDGDGRELGKENQMTFIKIEGELSREQDDRMKMLMTEIFTFFWVEQIWERVDIAPMLCPEAAAGYGCDRRGRAVARSRDELILKARQHIAALGWIIESNSEGKLRFISPDETIFGNLREACRFVTEQEEKEPIKLLGRKTKAKIKRGRKGDCVKKWKRVNIKPRSCPEAVEEYARNKRPKLSTKAKKHIVSLGWVIESDGWGRIRYAAPDRTVNYSLHQVCKFLTEKKQEAKVRGAEEATED
ncbi:hypothetical protein QJS10_CPA03g01209 [Acorus calamus]|uniref:DUF7028 domain-containing protein n=1 Tax=Acorus calamus TaxID=4465 RepID=A0AAV9FAK5_ACOCL|nr:hypothetical protein QJS10_CPA03g01209 [Acorus calamus]